MHSVMRIRTLEIEGFRSIDRLRIEDLDKPFVIIEGPNDVGKSNLVEALELAFHVLPQSLLKDPSTIGQDMPVTWPPSWDQRRLATSFRYLQDEFRIAVEVRLDLQDRTPGKPAPPGGVLRFAMRWKRHLPDPGNAPVRKNIYGDAPPMTVAVTKLELTDPSSLYESKEVAFFFTESYRLLDTHRRPGEERLSGTDAAQFAQLQRWEGNNLKRLLFLYKNNSDDAMQERFERLREVLADPALGVGRFNIALDGEFVRARTQHNEIELDLESRGTGVQQTAILLALAICHRGRILAIEEPELNLSSDNQRLVWRKLRDVVSERILDQIFVTSHSHVFEEQAERLVVERDAAGATQVHWEKAAPAPPELDVELLPVSRGGEVTLPEAIRESLGVQEGKKIYFVPDESAALW